MLWSYVKQNLIDLGFEEENYLQDPLALSIFCTSTNKARRIVSQIKPKIERFDFTQKSLGETTTELSDGATTNPIVIEIDSVPTNVTAEAGNFVIAKTLVNGNYVDTTYTFNGSTWTDSPFVRYDLTTLVDDFDTLDNVQRIYGDDISDFADYTIEQGTKIVMKGATLGSYTFFYTPKLTNITSDTADDFDIQIDYEVEHLVPLLAGHYAWLDDDIQKATMYYNEFEAERNLIMQRIQQRKDQKTKMRIVGGFQWH